MLNVSQMIQQWDVSRWSRLPHWCWLLANEEGRCKGCEGADVSQDSEWVVCAVCCSIHSCSRSSEPRIRIVQLLLIASLPTSTKLPRKVPCVSQARKMHSCTARAISLSRDAETWVESGPSDWSVLLRVPQLRVKTGFSDELSRHVSQLWWVTPRQAGQGWQQEPSGESWSQSRINPGSLLHALAGSCSAHWKYDAIVKFRFFPIWKCYNPNLQLQRREHGADIYGCTRWAALWGLCWWENYNVLSNGLSIRAGAGCEGWGEREPCDISETTRP